MLKEKPFCKISNAAALLPSHVDNNTGFVVALLRKDVADMSVVYVLPTLGAAEAVLRRVGQGVERAAKKNGTTVAAKDTAVVDGKNENAAADAKVADELAALAA